VGQVQPAAPMALVIERSLRETLDNNPEAVPIKSAA
jgi:hypothetical protein